jgi:hypothetical protein
VDADNAAHRLLEFQRLIPDSVGIAMRAADPADFLGWVRDKLLGYAAPDSPLHGDTNLGRAMAFAWARAVWNGLPLNAHGSKPRSMPEPGPEEPCPCGSGNRFHDCCLAVPQMPSLTPDVLWPYVLANIQGAERDELLSSSRIPRAALIEFAAHLLDLRRCTEVIAALEPRLAAPERYHDEDTAILLDLLCEAYGMSAQGARCKLKLLQDTTERAPRSPLRSEAWQRLASIYMDRGESGRAWSAFDRARQDNPQADELCVLEVELLVAGHRIDEAKQRAREWAATLASHGAPIDDPRMEFLSRMAANPLDRANTTALKVHGAELSHKIGLHGVHVRDSTNRTLNFTGTPAGSQLREWLARVAGRAVPVYRLAPAAAPPCFVLTTPPALLKLQRTWHDVFPLGKPFSAQDQPFVGDDVWEPSVESQWCAFLEVHPEGSDSLDILDDLATAVGRHAQAQSPGLEASLLSPLLERTAMLVEAACRSAGDVLLPWSIADNRPALRGLFRLLQQHLGWGNGAAAITVAEKLLRLNPSDDHGVRATLEQLREQMKK